MHGLPNLKIYINWVYKYIILQIPCIITAGIQQKCYNCQEYKTSLSQECSIFLSGESMYPAMYQKRNDRLQASLGRRVKEKKSTHAW
jgi:hypothetical protein